MTDYILQHYLDQCDYLHRIVGTQSLIENSQIVTATHTFI
jgi:hypothetical protein